MLPLKKILSYTLAFVLAAGCSQPNDKVMIATAANVQYVMQELQKAFERETGIQTEMVVSSSGKLTTQIREGAPFDVFVSADTRYPQEIYNHGGGQEPPRVYARGALVLWTADSTAVPGLSVLTSDTIRKIALANPQTAPYGRAAVQVLEKAGLYDKVRTKLVYGESIAQTTQFIQTRAADVGFTALSVVLSPELKQKGRWIKLDSTSYEPIEQSAVLLMHSEDSPKLLPSRRFYEFLYSSKARAIFRQYGYTVQEDNN